MSIHPTVQKALNGENVSAAEIQAMGGYEAFDNAIKAGGKQPKAEAAPKPRKPRKTKPYEPEEPTADAQRWFWVFKVIGVLVFAAMCLYTCYGS